MSRSVLPFPLNRLFVIASLDIVRRMADDFGEHPVGDVPPAPGWNQDAGNSSGFGFAPTACFNFSAILPAEDQQETEDPVPLHSPSLSRSVSASSASRGFDVNLEEGVEDGGDDDVDGDDDEDDEAPSPPPRKKRKVTVSNKR